MTASTYTNPNDPYDPNGISHYVDYADRHTVKLLYAAWLETWRDAYRNNTTYPAPFEYSDLYGGYVVYDGSYSYDGSQTY